MCARFARQKSFSKINHNTPESNIESACLYTVYLQILNWKVNPQKNISQLQLQLAIFL